MFSKKLITAMLLVLSFNNSAAQACAEKQYRQFDFWLGDWQVTAKTDNVIRTSKISLINDGCTLLEEYSTPSGYLGKSLNIYVQQTKTWHQTWTDNAGLLLLLKGEYVNGSMVMTGVTLDKSNNEIINKITWTANTDGTVSQHWQSKQSDEKTWQTLFDGTYTKSVN